MGWAGRPDTPITDPPPPPPPPPLSNITLLWSGGGATSYRSALCATYGDVNEVSPGTKLPIKGRRHIDGARSIAKNAAFATRRDRTCLKALTLSPSGSPRRCHRHQRLRFPRILLNLSPVDDLTSAPKPKPIPIPMEGYP